MSAVRWFAMFGVSIFIFIYYFSKFADCASDSIIKCPGCEDEYCEDCIDDCTDWENMK